jgi:Spy/CpxP family protein refolding chaperone
MLKHISIVMIVIMLIFTSSAVLAQGMAGDSKKHAGMPFGKWWQNPAAIKKLSLTQEEVDTLDTAFNTRARKFMELKHAIELEQFEINGTMEGKTLDESALMAQFNKLESARANLSRERFQYYVQVRKILGPDRFRKIKAFRQRMQQQNNAAMIQRNKQKQ